MNNILKIIKDDKRRDIVQNNNVKSLPKKHIPDDILLYKRILAGSLSLLLGCSIAFTVLKIFNVIDRFLDASIASVPIGYIDSPVSFIILLILGILSSLHIYDFLLDFSFKKEK